MSKNKSSFLKVKIQVKEDFNIGPGKITLLESIIKNGSIAVAAKKMGMSYKKAWKLVKEINVASSNKIILSNAGGKGVGGTKISEEGIKFIKTFREIENKVFKATINEKKYLYDLFSKN